MTVDSRYQLLTQDPPETSVLLDHSGPLWRSGSEKLRQMSEDRRSDCSPAAGTSAQAERGESSQ